MWSVYEFLGRNASLFQPRLKSVHTLLNTSEGYSTSLHNIYWTLSSGKILISYKKRFVVQRRFISWLVVWVTVPFILYISKFYTFAKLEFFLTSTIDVCCKFIYSIIVFYVVFFTQRGTYFMRLLWCGNALLTIIVWGTSYAKMASFPIQI